MMGCRCGRRFFLSYLLTAPARRWPFWMLFEERANQARVQAGRRTFACSWGRRSLRTPVFVSA